MEGDNFPFFVGICAVIRVVLAVPYVLIAKYEAKYRGFAMWEVARVLAEGFCFTVPIFTSRSQVRRTGHAAVWCVAGRAHAGSEVCACGFPAQYTFQLTMLYIAALFRYVGTPGCCAGLCFLHVPLWPYDIV